MTEITNLAALWHDKLALADCCRDKLRNPHYANWDKSLLAFIVEWYDDDDFVIVHTSGSTGPPEPIRIKKKRLVNSARMTLDYLGLGEGDRALLCLPSDNIAGKMMLVRSMVGNLNLTAIEPRGNPLENLEDGFDFAAMIPLQVHNILNNPRGKKKIESIRKLIIGGGAIPAPLEEGIKELNNEVFSTYGMTETVSHIALRRLNGAERSPYYTILPGVTIDKDANDCLVVDAPDIADSLVRTRDIVRIFYKKEFEVLGRLDNVINSGGIKYNPEIIERKLEEVISDRFIVSSVPDARLGDKIVLIIETSDPRKYESPDFKNSVNGKLPVFERPKDLFFLEHFPETGNSKIQRKKIADRAIAQQVIRERGEK
ncbi:MAG: AMP-binding protein [Deltaproteobacteria bacterium]|nr:AMP-binding protein [Deltaproteobacteria bacterium]